MRPIALCLAAAAVSLAFAPAPLPRRAPSPTGNDLSRLQGNWTRVTYNGHPTPYSLIVVKGDVWRVNVPNDAWVLKLDPTTRPKRIDLIKVGQQQPSFRGVYTLEGDTFTYSLGYNVPEDKRP